MSATPTTRHLHTLGAAVSAIVVGVSLLTAPAHATTTPVTLSVKSAATTSGVKVSVTRVAKDSSYDIDVDTATGYSAKFIARVGFSTATLSPKDYSYTLYPEEKTAALAMANRIKLYWGSTTASFTFPADLFNDGIPSMRITSWSYTSGTSVIPLGTYVSGTGRTSYCPKVVVAVSRGSGEVKPNRFGGGLGNIVSQYVTNLRRQMAVPAGEIITIANPYPAVAVDQPSVLLYQSSRSLGITHLGTMVTSVKGRCSSTKLILSGYSQGADVDGLWFIKNPLQRSSVYAIVAFADPYTNAKDTEVELHPSSDARGYLSALFGHIRTMPVGTPPYLSFCNEGDPICDNPEAKAPWTMDLRLHSEYNCATQYAAYRHAVMLGRSGLAAAPVRPTCSLIVNLPPQ